MANKDECTCVVLRCLDSGAAFVFITLNRFMFYRMALCAIAGYEVIILSVFCSL